MGRTLQMRAVVRDAAGNPIPSAAVTWSVNQTQRARFRPSGTSPRAAWRPSGDRALRRGSGVAAIQTIPSRVEVNPPSAKIEVGTQMKFQAAAYDADDGQFRA